MTQSLNSLATKGDSILIKTYNIKSLKEIYKTSHPLSSVVEKSTLLNQEDYLVSHSEKT